MAGERNQLGKLLCAAAFASALQTAGLLSEPAQIGIEVSVPQPGGYKKFSVRRDLVIWPRGGMTCWNDQWEPVCHPLAILEWKVHRLHRRNPDVLRERAWLRAYCSWQPSVLGYAIEVDCTVTMTAIACSRFLGTDEKKLWLEFQCAGIAQDRMQSLSGH